MKSARKRHPTLDAHLPVAWHGSSSGVRGGSTGNVVLARFKLFLQRNASLVWCSSSGRSRHANYSMPRRRIEGSLVCYPRFVPYISSQNGRNLWLVCTCPNVILSADITDDWLYFLPATVVLKHGKQRRWWVRYTCCLIFVKRVYRSARDTVLPILYMSSTEASDDTKRRNVYLSHSLP